MGVKERRDRERTETRTKILDAARELFINEGFEAVSMRRIAEAIEYSPTAIYVHFRDKEALFQELCAHDFTALAHGMQDLAHVADPVERIRLAGHGYLRFAITHPNHYRLMFMTPRKVGAAPDKLAQRGDPMEDAYALLRNSTAEAIAAGRFRPDRTDPELLAQTFWAGVHGVASLQIALATDHWVDWRGIDDRADAMIDTLLIGMGANVDAAIRRIGPRMSTNEHE
jgi:AcrR family transcriptional regulator